MKQKFTFLVLIISLLTFVTNAQEAAPQETKKFEPTYNVKGYFQTNYVYSFDTTGNGDENNPMGFSLRRLRFMPYGDLTENVSWGMQLAADKMAFSLITAYVNIKLMDETVQLKGGLIDNGGARQGSGISSSNLILVQRALPVQMWGGSFDTKGYFDLGLRLHGKVNMLSYSLLLANPKGATAFDNTALSKSQSNSFNGIKTIGRLNVAPMEGLELGGFFGYETYKDATLGGKEAQVNTTFGLDAIYKTDIMDIQAGYLAGSNKNENDPDVEGVNPFEYNGLYLNAGYQIGKIMPVVGYDMYTPNADASTTVSFSNITVGLNAYLWKGVKIQANYIMRQESEKAVEFDNDMIMFNLQYSFGKKNL